MKDQSDAHFYINKSKDLKAKRVDAQYKVRNDLKLYKQIEKALHADSHKNRHNDDRDHDDDDDREHEDEDD